MKMNFNFIFSPGCRPGCDAAHKAMFGRLFLAAPSAVIEGFIHQGNV